MSPVHQQVKLLDYIIYLLLLFYLLVDTFNGVLVMKYGISISVGYKMTLLFLMTVSIAFKNVNVLTYVFFCFTILAICILSYFDNQEIDFGGSVSSIIKLITIPCYFLYFIVSLRRRESFYYRRYKKIMGINLLVFLGNMIIGMLGYGFYTYAYAGGGFGIKGFFYAGNEVAVLFLCLYYYFLSGRRGKLRYMTVIYIAGISLSILIGTKTGVLACFVLSTIDCYYRLSKKGKLIGCLVFPPLLLILFTVIQQTEFYQFAEQRILRSIHGDNIMNMLLSGRLTVLEDNYEYWKETLSIRTFLLGTGSPFVPRIVMKGIEMDIFSTFFYWGIVVLAIVLSFYLWIIASSVTKKKKGLALFNIVYLGISVMAGHVWYSVMAGLFFACLNAYELNKERFT